MIIVIIKVLLGEHPRREIHPVNRREPSISQGRTHHAVSTAQVQHTDGCDDGHDDDDDDGGESELPLAFDIVKNYPKGASLEHEIPPKF